MRATSLNHEVLDDPVEVQAVVEPVIHQPEKVPGGLGAVLGVECNSYWAGAGCHPDYGWHMGSLQQAAQ